MSDAREKAVERLAAVLTYVYGIGLDSHRTDDPGKRIERGVADGLADPGGFPFHRDADLNAAMVMDALGLIAIDPALVEAVRSAEGCFTNCAGPLRGATGDANTVCDQCAAKMDLADAVLAQVKP